MVASTYVPPTLQVQASSIVNNGVDPLAVTAQHNPALALHVATQPGAALSESDAVCRGIEPVSTATALLATAGVATAGAILLKDAIDKTKKTLAKNQSAAATGNMPDPDDNGEGDEDETAEYSQQTKKLLKKTDEMKAELFEREGAPKDATSLSAARTELQGEQIAKAAERGVTYDHVSKVQSAQTGLSNHIDAINARLSWTELPQAERVALQKELGKASRLLDYTKQFVPK